MVCKNKDPVLINFRTVSINTDILCFTQLTAAILTTCIFAAEVCQVIRNTFYVIQGPGAASFIEVGSGHRHGRFLQPYPAASR